MTGLLRITSIISFLFLIGVFDATAQNDSLFFTYNGVDAKLSELNYHNNHYGGFDMGVAGTSDVIYAVVPSLHYEYAYLLFKRNETANISLNGKPAIALFDLFLVRLSTSANFVLGSAATTKPSKNPGLSIGLGYEYINSTFNFQEDSPFINIYLLVENFRIGFQQNFGSDIIIASTVSAGVKFDW